MPSDLSAKIQAINNGQDQAIRYNPVPSENAEVEEAEHAISEGDVELPYVPQPQKREACKEVEKMTPLRFSQLVANAVIAMAAAISIALMLKMLFT